MKNCTICGTELNKKSLDITKMLSKEEGERLFSVRRDRGICSECSITMLMLNLQ